MPSKAEWALVRRYCGRFSFHILFVVGLTLIANALTLIAPALVAAALAIFNLSSAAPAAGAPSAFDLNQLGSRVLALWPFRQFTDTWSLLMVVGVVYVTQAAVVSGLNYVIAFSLVRIRSEVTRLIQQDLMEHLLSLSLSFFHKSRSGELVARVTHDARGFGHAIGPVVQGVLQSGVQLVGFGLFLFQTSGWLTLAALMIVAGHFGLSYSLKRPTRERAWAAEDAQAVMSSVLHETLVAIRVAKSFGAEHIELAKADEATRSLKRANIAYGHVESLSEPVRHILDALALAGVLVVAAFQLRSGSLTPQGLILYLFVARMVIAPANDLAKSYLRLQSILNGLQRINALRALRPEVVDGDLSKRTFTANIELRGVSFSYGDVHALHDVSLEIPKGHVVALVGPSGAGKSTLTDLVLRLYDPSDGRILIDGIDLRRLKSADYRSLFGVVSQESLLFHDTIANNIRYGREHVTDDDIRHAARIANAEDFIIKLPQRYDTVVGDRGVRLSGGERQRVSIARAIVHDPQILILDEATSALDSESERQVQKAIESVTKGKTTIVIAHRLSTVVRADSIAVIDAGRIVDVGRHADLLERCELYRHLCALQFFAAPNIEAAPVPQPAAM